MIDEVIMLKMTFSADKKSNAEEDVINQNR